MVFVRAAPTTGSAPITGCPTRDSGLSIWGSNFGLTGERVRGANDHVECTVKSYSNENIICTVAATALWGYGGLSGGNVDGQSDQRSRQQR